MKENYTHISVVLDRSGSMTSMRNEVVKGFEAFINGQKAVEGEATLTMVQFDDQIDILHDMTPLKDVSGLGSFQPRGSTALLDAMGETMNNVRTKIMAMEEANRPSKVIFVFITDGQENASSKYKRKDIFEMIKDQRSEANWEFVFIGANQDAISEGNSIGVRASAAITFDASGAGATRAFTSLTKGMTMYRSKADADYAFSDEDRKAQDELMDDPILSIKTKSL